MSLELHATLEVFFLILIGALGVALSFQKLLIVWPLVVLYGALVWRYSMSYLLASKLLFPKWIHYTLWFFHIPLAFSFSYPRIFILEMIVFLLMETWVFAQMAIALREPRLLLRKMKIALVEALLALFALAGVLFTEYTQLILILWGIVAIDITLYIIFSRQMYHVPQDI